MNYKIEHIIKACELSDLTKEQTDVLCSNLRGAVKLLNEIKVDTLSDFFGQFCIQNEVTEKDIKSAKRDENLVKLRKKFTISAKERFPKHSNREIGLNINRDHATIIHYFKREKTRKEKRDNLERMKNGC